MPADKIFAQFIAEKYPGDLFETLLQDQKFVGTRQIEKRVVEDHDSLRMLLKELKQLVFVGSLGHKAKIRHPVAQVKDARLW